MNDNHEIAILIPCYNEAQTIEKVVKDFRAALPDAKVFVYDNNSTDGTATIARKAGAIVKSEPRQGKGNVLRSMLRDIDAVCYILVDGDDTYPAESSTEMARLVLEEGVNMVIGDRLSSTYGEENKRLFHNFGNGLVRSLVNTIFRSDITDIMTGYRAFDRGFAKTFPILSQGFEIETEMTIHALDKNFIVRSIPVNYRDRPAGSISKLNTFTDGMRVLRTIVSLYKNYKPLQFFSLIALMTFIISAAFFTPVLVEYFRSGFVPRFPTMIVACILLTMSLLFLTTGIILDTVAREHRRLFEMVFVMITKDGTRS